MEWLFSFLRKISSLYSFVAKSKQTKKTCGFQSHDVDERGVFYFVMLYLPYIR